MTDGSAADGDGGGSPPSAKRRSARDLRGAIFPGLHSQGQYIRICNSMCYIDIYALSGTSTVSITSLVPPDLIGYWSETRTGDRFPNRIGVHDHLKARERPTGSQQPSISPIQVRSIRGRSRVSIDFRQPGEPERSGAHKPF